MYSEVTYSTQIFLPSIISGVLLLSAAVALFLFYRLRERVYLASFLTLVVAFGYVFCNAMSAWLSDTHQVAMGLQVSRIEQLLAATFIPLTPYLVYSLGDFVFPKLQRTVIKIAWMMLGLLILVAFTKPDWFVSVTNVSPAGQFREFDSARGAHGMLFTVRDLLLVSSFVYGIIMLSRLRKMPATRSMARPMTIGITAAVALSFLDVLNAYLQFRMLLQPVLDFSWSSLGIGIWGLAVAHGAFQRFLRQLLDSEQNYRAARDLIRDVVDAMDSVVIGVDESRHVTFWNNQTVKMTGIQKADAVGRAVEEALPKLRNELDAIEAAIKRNTVTQEEKRLQLSSGEFLYEELRILPLGSTYARGAVLISTNITEKKRLQETIVQTEKMVSLGGLAAGMAHEINNPLAGVLQNAQLARKRLLNRSAVNEKAIRAAGITFEGLEAYLVQRGLPELLEAVVTSGKRAALIIRNMLEFSRKDTGSVGTVALSELLESVLDIARNDWDLEEAYDFKNISIIRDYDQSLPDVPCEPQNLSQVFFNIIKNAAQALHSSRTTKPVVTLRTRAVPEGKVRVEIDDNGPGIPASIQKRVFDPFYTTKQVGEGTGLGLSVAYFIVVEHHKGTIEVLTPRSGGTRFVVELPLNRE